MKKPDNDNNNHINQSDEVIKQLIGMGKHSARKSYYPMLQQKINELNREKIRYKTMIDCMADAVLIINDEGIMVDVNLEACNRYKYSRSEMIGMPISEIDPVQSGTDILEKISSVIQKKNLRFETIHTTKDKINIETEIIANRIEYDNDAAVICACRNISELKHAEKELKSSQNQLQSIFKAAPCGIGVFTNRFITYINDYFCEMTGYTEDELLGENSQILYLTKNEYNRVGDEQYNQIVEKGFGSVETQFRRKDGQILDIKLSSSPLDMSDWSKGITLTAIDITQEKATEKALEKRIVALTKPLENTDISFAELFNLEEIQNIQDLFSAATGVGSVITDTKGEYITTPSCFCNFCTEIVNGAQNGEMACKASASTLGKVNTKGPTIEPCEECGILSAGASITIGGKHIANWLIGHVRKDDHNERKVIELARKIGVDEQLALSEFEKTPSMTVEQFSIVANALFAFANQLSNTAYQNVQQAHLIYKSKRAEEVVKNYNKVLKSEVDKRTAELESKNQLLQTEIEERTRAEEELKTTQTHLVQSEKMASIGQLASNIAHEINTPLGAIGSSNGIIKQFFDDIIQLIENYSKLFQSKNSELIKKIVRYSSLQDTPMLSTREMRQIRNELMKQLEGKVTCSTSLLAGFFVNTGMSDTFEEYLPLFNSPESECILDMLEKITSIYQGNTIIENAIQQSSRIVFALKEYARAGDPEMKVLANIKKSLETAIILYTNKIKHGLEMELEFGEVPDIFCFPNELNQVWTNLIHNSIQAMEEQGKLKISMNEINNSIVVKVTDSGCGIPEDIRDKIFAPLFTTKPSGLGSGLGLDIVKRIIERHNGDITVESEVGVGTTFTVTLPILYSSASTPKASVAGNG